jgi:hypothetical protein
MLLRWRMSPTGRVGDARLQLPLVLHVGAEPPRELLWRDHAAGGRPCGQWYGMPA